MIYVFQLDKYIIRGSTMQQTYFFQVDLFSLHISLSWDKRHVHKLTQLFLSDTYDPMPMTGAVPFKYAVKNSSGNNKKDFNINRV